MTIVIFNIHDMFVLRLQVGMTKTDAAVQTLSDINPDVVLEASVFSVSNPNY